MRGDFFEFEPTFKLLISGNYKPQLPSVDPAMRRRFNSIPLTATFAPEEIDRELRDVNSRESGPESSSGRSMAAKSFSGKG